MPKDYRHHHAATPVIDLLSLHGEGKKPIRFKLLRYNKIYLSSVTLLRQEGQ